MKNLLKETFVDYKFAIAMACMFTLANYCLTVHRENVRLEGIVEISEMRSDVNNDFVNKIIVNNDVFRHHHFTMILGFFCNNDSVNSNNDFNIVVKQ